MKKGDCATFYMKKTLLAKSVRDERIYSGIVFRYDEKTECIDFQLESGELTELSLDAIYECVIQTEHGSQKCTGRMKERYCGKEGKIFKFEIENGFYKINLK